MKKNNERRNDKRKNERNNHKKQFVKKPFSNKKFIKKNQNNEAKKEVKIENQIIYGVNPIKECMQQDYTFDKLYLQKKEDSKSQQIFIDYCKKKKIQFFFVDKKELDYKCNHNNHQGVLADLKKGLKEVIDLNEFLNKQEQKNKKKIIIILDQITDPVNIATITRTSVFFGCSLIILPKKNSCPIDATVHKISSGASLMVPFHFNDNLVKSIEILKENNFDIYSSSLSENSIEIDKINFSNNTAIIIGSEGKGIRPHILEKSDSSIKINQNSSLNSLNAAIATGIILYKISFDLY